MPVRNFSNSYLSECVTLGVTIRNRKGYVITLYRFPSQTSDEFQSFIRDFEKVILLEAYKAVNKFDIICLSESFVDSSILTENNNLKNNGYKMVRADDPNNVKKGGMCAYVRDSLPVRNLSNSYCLTLEVNISSKKGYVITLHRSPS